MMHADDSERRGGQTTNSKMGRNSDRSGGRTQGDRNNRSAAPPAEEAATATASSRTGEQQREASFMDKVSATVGNCCKHTGLCCFKFKEQSHITALELKLTNRQKKFGVDYLDLVERKASQQALKNCLQSAMADIGEIQNDINRHHDAIEKKEGEVHLADDGAGTKDGAAANTTVTYSKKPKGSASSSVEGGSTSLAPKNSSHNKGKPKK